MNDGATEPGTCVIFDEYMHLYVGCGSFWRNYTVFTMNMDREYVRLDHHFTIGSQEFYEKAICNSRQLMLPYEEEY